MKISLVSNCQACGEEMILSSEIDPRTLAPAVRGNVLPDEVVYRYRITSQHLKEFITEKAKQYVPDVKIDLEPKYCEKKHRKGSNLDIHRSYASLRIAFSENVVERNEDLGFYSKIGENSNVRITRSVMDNIIRKYQYRKKEIDTWTKNYRIMEELEERFGMTEEYIRDLKEYSTPIRVQTNNAGESWIFFSAAPENVIRDYLTEVDTNSIKGTLTIKDVYPISKGIVEFKVELDPTQISSVENIHVRQILTGEAKGKKY